MHSDRTGQDRESGVLFVRDADGRRGSAAPGRAVWAAAARDVDPALASRIEQTADWRVGYLDGVVAHTAVAARSAQASLAIARAGLAAVREQLEFVRNGAAVPLEQALVTPGPALRPQTVQGHGSQQRTLAVPYRGAMLRGDELRRQADAWVARGTVEASCAAALHELVAEPDRLDMSGRAFALLGAGAEMGPLEPLLQWGGHVVAVDRPDEKVWERITGQARAGAGRLTFPQGGVDLLTATPEVAAFVGAAADRPLTVGSYAYADGARHVQLAAAADALVEMLLRDRPGTGYAELATPTDAFAVPGEVVEEARRRWAGRGRLAALQAPARRLGLYAPSYPTTLEREDGAVLGIADVLVPQQGPNYTLAKRIQRWRAVAASAAGHPVSANVAPATRTRSVTRNRLLAAAYAGAHAFGVEVFEPATSRVLMAALLAHDLTSTAPPPAHPEDLFVSGAAHGGLWRVGYTPRSVLGLAAVRGLPAALRR